MDFWTILLAVSGPVGAVVLFAMHALTIRKIQKDGEKTGLEIEKLQADKEERSSKILLPNDEDIEKFGRPLQFEILKFPLYLWVVLSLTAYATVALGIVALNSEGLERKRIKDREFVQQNLNAMAVKLGEMQAELIRLDSTGERIGVLVSTPGSEKPEVLAAERTQRLAELANKIDKLKMQMAEMQVSIGTASRALEPVPN